MGLFHVTMGLLQGCHVDEGLASLWAALVLSSLVISSQVVAVEHVGHQAVDRMPRYTNKDIVTSMCNLSRWEIR